MILQGECKCIYEKIVSRSQEQHAKLEKKGFSFGMRPYKRNKNKTKKPSSTKTLNKQEEFQTIRSFENQKIKVLSLANKELVHKNLYLGHVFILLI